MKKILLILLITISVVAYSQVYNPPTQVISFFKDTDTLEIPKHIRFIKIDGEVYEIKRNVSVEKVNQLWYHPDYGIQVDTTWNWNKNYLQTLPMGNQ